MQTGPVPAFEVQLDLLEAPSSPASAGPGREPADRRDRLTVDLGRLGPALRLLARQQRTNVSALIRRALRPLLEGEAVARDSALPRPAETGRMARVNLKLPYADAMALARRAEAGDMSRSELVRSLLAGLPPAVVAPDHAEAVRALIASNDRMAVLAADLRDFVRLLSRAAAARPELAAYRARIASLEQDVRSHLKQASLLAAELRPHGRRRG